MSDTVLNDLDFVKFYFNRSHYEDYIQYLDRDLLTREPNEFITAIKDFYEDHKDVKQIDPDSFSTWFLQFKMKPDLTDTSKQTYKLILDKIKERPDTSTDIIVKQMKFKSVSNRLLDVANKKLNVDRLKQLVEEAEEADTKEDFLKDVMLVDDCNKLFSDESFTSGLDWSLKCLNENIHKVPDKGFFCVLAARPGTAKSSMCINFAVNFAKQLKPGELILWFNNENVSQRMKRRAAVCLFNENEDTLAKALEDGRDIQKDYEEALGGRDNILFFDVHNRDHTFLERIIKHYKKQVKLIFIDMLDHVGLTKHMSTVASNSDAYYGILYQWALGISCTYASVIGTSQISLIKGDPRYPRMEDLSHSKTSKQGAVSCQIMVGSEQGSRLRYITTPKNKYGKGGTTWDKTIELIGETCQMREI